MDQVQTLTTKDCKGLQTNMPKNVGSMKTWSAKMKSRHIKFCKQKEGETRYPLTSVNWPYRGLRCRPIDVEYFFQVIRWQVTSFQKMAGSSLFFEKFIWNMLCLCHYGPALLRFWFQTNLGRESSASYLEIQAGKIFSYQGYALVTLYVKFLCPDWSKFDRWVRVENLCSILKLVYSWSWQSFVSTCDVFNRLFPLDVPKKAAAIKSILLFMASLFIGFLVERCVACQSRKSDFGWHRFRFSPCLMRKRVQKSQAILALLHSFQEMHLQW